MGGFGVNVGVQDVSPVLNPLPRIVTTVPTAPELGLSTIVGVGDTTVKVAVAMSFIWFPVIVHRYQSVAPLFP